jgi:hypothetical protein
MQFCTEPSDLLLYVVSNKTKILVSFVVRMPRKATVSSLVTPAICTQKQLVCNALTISPVFNLSGSSSITNYFWAD